MRCIKAFTTTTALEKLTGKGWEGFVSSGLVNSKCRCEVSLGSTSSEKHMVQLGLYSPKIETGASWDPKKHRWFRKALQFPAFRFYL